MKVLAEDAKGLLMNCLRFFSCGMKCEHCGGIRITMNDGIIRLYSLLRCTILIYGNNFCD